MNININSLQQYLLLISLKRVNFETILGYFFPNVTVQTYRNAHQITLCFKEINKIKASVFYLFYM